MPGACCCETRLFESPTISSGRMSSHSWKPPVKKNKAITPRGKPPEHQSRQQPKHTKHVEQRWPENASKPTERPPGRTPSRQLRQHNQRFRNQRRGDLSAVYSSQPAITATPAASSTAKTSDRAHDQSRLRAPPRGHPRNRNSKAKAPGGNRR